MMRILSWSSGLGGDKLQTSDPKLFVPKQEVTSAVGSPLHASVKRKRSPSCDEQSGRPFVYSLATNQTNHASQPISPTSMSDSSDMSCLQHERARSIDIQPPNPTTAGQHRGATAALTDSQLESMRQTISVQLNLEILVKHKELRLIDQEIAKCQIALEQLRRCTEIPYPATQQPSTLVSDGKGPAIQKFERYAPESPAPWGVADGPYTRHYSQWLLPDRRFDGGKPDIQDPQAVFNVSATGRSTRGHVVDVLDSKAMQSRSQRGNLKSLPAGYGQPKEKATGPMILKRKSDGKMVKLVCPDCGRHDFGSAQGFINHCRIGHGRSFASHDAAAEACGEAVEYDENGTMKGSEPVSTPTSTHVHPLIRSAKLVWQTPVTSPIVARNDSVSTTGKKTDHAARPKPVPASFHGSSETPHLSALIKNQGLGLNLQDLVTEAKLKISPSESEDEVEEMEIDSPVPVITGRHPQVAGSKQPVKSTVTNPSPLLNSRMRFDTSSQSGISPLPSQTSVRDDCNQQESFASLLPSPTNESTQAPSLVDDDEEYDPQSPPSSDDLDDQDVDFEVHDDEQGDREATLRNASAATTQSTCTSAPAARQATAIRHGLVVHPADRHVSFASPSPAPEASSRKRRKLDEK